MIVLVGATCSRRMTSLSFGCFSGAMGSSRSKERTSNESLKCTYATLQIDCYSKLINLIRWTRGHRGTGNDASVPIRHNDKLEFPILIMFPSVIIVEILEGLAININTILDYFLIFFFEEILTFKSHLKKLVGHFKTVTSQEKLWFGVSIIRICNSRLRCFMH